VSTDRWVWVSLTKATFALCVRNGRVTDGPPYAQAIIRRLGTDDWRAVAGYLVQRKAVFAELPEIASLVVHCKRSRYDVYIGRPGIWGNPFAVGKDGGREEVIAKYEKYLRGRPDLMRRLPELRGKVLGCWCAPKACHGDVLARLAARDA
jgi:Domain of unknown function (DUF4326)